MSIRRGRGRPAVRPEVTLEEERQAIQALVDQEEGAEYELGVHFNRIVAGKLWRQGPYKSATDFFKREVKDISASEVELYGAVARHFHRDAAMRFGMSNLSALLTYAAVTHRELPQDALAKVPVTVPTREGRTVKKRFEDCSRAELRAAIRLARQGDGEPRGRMPPEDRREVDFLRGSFANAIGLDPLPSLKAVFRNGTTLVSLENLPLDRVRDICAMLGHPPARDNPRAVRGSGTDG